MDVLDVANKRLKATRESFDQDYEAQIAKLADKESNLKQRLNDLENKKIKVSKKRLHRPCHGLPINWHLPSN